MFRIDPSRSRHEQVLQHALAAGLQRYALSPRLRPKRRAKGSRRLRSLPWRARREPQYGYARLNGQKGEYILIRLKEFLDRSRNTPHGRQMAPIAEISSMTQRPWRAISAGRPKPADQVLASVHRRGRDLSDMAPDRPFPPAPPATDPTGEGLGGTPRIAGQHGAYLMRQLGPSIPSARAGTAMNHHTWDMTLEQMQEVSAYLANN